MVDFYQNISGPLHDTISLPASDFANFAAMMQHTQFSGGNAIITAPNQDALTLLNVSQALLTANSADFTFHL